MKASLASLKLESRLLHRTTDSRSSRKRGSPETTCYDSDGLWEALRRAGLGYRSLARRS